MISSIPPPGWRHGVASRGPVGVRITNFKAIRSVELPDVRLTVLAGSNSSGKSSLLQAVLFLTQSVGQRNPVINGDLVRLGLPRDVIRDGASSLSFRFELHERGPGGSEDVQIAAELIMCAADENLRASEYRLRVGPDLVLRASSNGCDQDLKERLDPGEAPLRIDEAPMLDLPDEAYLTMQGVQPGRLIYRATRFTFRKSFDRLLRDRAMAAYVFDDLVRSVDTHGDGVTEELRAKLNEARHGRKSLKLSDPEQEQLFELFFQGEAPGGWASVPITLQPLGMARSAFRSSFARRTPAETPALSAVGPMGILARAVDSFAGSVVYLGPLRDDPRVAYPLGHTVTNLPVGEKGEFTAAYLEQEGERWVQYQTPDGRPARTSLLTAVSRWCKHLGIADTVDVEGLGKLGHQLKLEIYGQERDPTAVGVGASQLLPVVVLVLGASPGSLALLEQPELHLHPKVQSRLGDFFALARPDVRVLVETHSEYLITRLRLRVAQGELSRQQLAVLFAHQEVVDHPIEENGEERLVQEVFSEFRRLELDSRGDFDAWPEDFFDTLNNDSVQLAIAVGKQLAEERETLH